MYLTRDRALGSCLKGEEGEMETLEAQHTHCRWAAAREVPRLVASGLGTATTGRDAVGDGWDGACFLVWPALECQLAQFWLMVSLKPKVPALEVSGVNE